MTGHQTDRWFGTYRLLGDFDVTAGGNCTCVVAEVGAERYFIKRFLRPRYPLDTSPGSAAGKARRRREFEEFERYQEAKLQAIKHVASSGGRLVVPVTQFRHETFWYTVAPWIDHDGRLTVEDIARRGMDSRLLMMVTAAAALRAVHAAGIVHGDIKPDNILISPSVSDDYHAFLIDFDSSYFDGQPPAPELVMGDMTYYSPELLDYVQRQSAPATVTRKSDIFALGLVYCQFLTGRLPETSGDHAYLAEVARAGHPPRIGAESLDPRLEVLLWEMMRPSAELRPSAAHVYDRIRELMWDQPAEHRPPAGSAATAYGVPPAPVAATHVAPSFTYPAPPAGPPMPAPAATPAWPVTAPRPAPIDGSASAALWIGLAGLLCCGFLSPVAIVLGHSARKRIRSSGGRLGGMERATAGMVLGVLEAVFLGVYLLSLAVQAAH